MLKQPLIYACGTSHKAHFLQEDCETRIQYYCTGAQMSNQQPGDADGMVAAARDYAQNNRGGKYHAILWPFAALNSYNMAEEKYQAVVCQHIV